MTPPPFDLRAWIDEQSPLEPEPPEPPPTQTRRPTNGRMSPLDRAIAYLLSPGFPESIEGEHGHNKLYRAACVGRDGFGLERADLYRALSEYNRAKAQPPEGEHQINHKVDDAIKNCPNPSLDKLNTPSPARDPTRPAHERNGHHAANGHASTNGHASGGKVTPWPVGTPVRCLDRGNHGTVAADDGGTHVAVQHDGANGSATVLHPRAGLVRLDGKGGEADDAEDLPPPNPRKPSELYREHPELRPVLIDGILRRSEIMNVVAPSKVGKSWLTLGLALSVAAGLKWLNRFLVSRGRVLIIDNELHPETIASRLKWVAESMGLSLAEYDERIAVESLRGQLRDLQSMGPYFAAVAGQYDVIMLDAGYRFLSPGEDENSNSAVTYRYNLLDSYATLTGSAFAYVHHASKGSQDGKSVTDVGAGAGAQSRAADTHLVLLSDAQLGPGRLTVDAAIRSFPPLDPFVIRREGPLWVEDGAPPKVAGKRRPIEPELFAASYACNEPRTKKEIIYRATQNGLSQRAAEATFDAAVSAGHLHPWKISRIGHRHPMYSTCPQPTNQEEDSNACK